MALDALLELDNEILRSSDGDVLRPFIEADWRTRCAYDQTMSNFLFQPDPTTRVCDSAGHCQVVPVTPPVYRPRNPTLAAVCRDLR